MRGLSYLCPIDLKEDGEKDGWNKKNKTNLSEFPWLKELTRYKKILSVAVRFDASVLLQDLPDPNQTHCDYTDEMFGETSIAPILMIRRGQVQLLEAITVKDKEGRKWVNPSHLKVVRVLTKE